MIIVDKLICRDVVGKGGQYVVGTLSVQYVVSTWSVHGRSSTDTRLLGVAYR